jgi:hypothetical protein
MCNATGSGCACRLRGYDGLLLCKSATKATAAFFVATSRSPNICLPACPSGSKRKCHSSIMNWHSGPDLMRQLKSSSAHRNHRQNSRAFALVSTDADWNCQGEGTAAEQGPHRPLVQLTKVVHGHRPRGAVCAPRRCSSAFLAQRAFPLQPATPSSRAAAGFDRARTCRT